MFGAPGHAYVYMIYGFYFCLNVVTEPEGRPAAVLVRAVEPVAGIDAIRRARIERELRRKRLLGDAAAAALARRRIEALPASRLCSGPGLVAAGFSLTRSDTGRDLLDPESPIRLEAGLRPPDVRTSARVGIDYAAEPWRTMAWRLIDPASPSVSGPPLPDLGAARR